MENNENVNENVEHENFEKKYFRVKKNFNFLMGYGDNDKEKLLDIIDSDIRLVENEVANRPNMAAPEINEVWLVDLGVNIGDEIYGERPCVVVSYNKFNHKSGSATIVPITRAKFSHKTQFAINDDLMEEVHDTIEGTVKTEQITTKSKSRFKVKIGKLNEEGINKLKKALIYHLVLSEDLEERE
ncbi:MAG: type II toxin-antitoxin system PemK/MazF family toxin [Clostridium sp.]|uniref:type II toxin-antitoxin system PemK/MazF family toxin n=1 Tax=Clostridium sp. TaxID=1506 RepID=UPI003F2DE98D